MDKILDIKDGFKILDFGCGRRKRPHSIGIDVNPRSDADIIHDLDIFPYPFPNNYFDEIYSDNVLEHLTDVLLVMNELHRIAKPKAKIFITVPFYAHRNASTDPTHKHFFGVHSFDYLIEGTNNSEFKYSAIHYELLSVEFEKGIQPNH